jgi:M-phase inducer tyrosine phosphatase
MDISTPSVEAMDIDSSFSSQPSSAPEARSPISAARTITQLTRSDDQDEPLSAAPTITKFDTYFYGSSSPIKAPDFENGDASISIHEQPAPKKRRSVSPEIEGGAPRRRSLPQRTLPLLDDTDVESSPAPIESPMVHKLERLNSKPALRGLPLPSLNANHKRPRRPVFSAMVTPGDIQGMLQSAYPKLEAQAVDDVPARAAPARAAGAVDEAPRPRPVRPVMPPVRRAFSAMIPTSVNPMEGSFESEGETSLSADASSPAQAYAARQQVKTIRRRDGTDDFRSVTGATALLMRDDEARGERRREEKVCVAERDTPRSKYLSGGGKLGGFGDNEAHGKILPCHRVREDGLMRITCKTVSPCLP